MPVDITTEVDDFRNAVYGEEVRGSMISLAEKLAESADNSEAVANQATTDVQEGLANITGVIDDAQDATAAANDAASSANDAAAAANSATDAANSAESSRASAEQARVSAEQARANAESARVTAEQARASAENQRVTAETARAGSETNRQDAESARREAETARASAEQGRVSAESARVAAETGRANAETSRASAESNRNSTFAAMQRSFADMVEQVMPPATTTTLGGVIVGEGLSVASDGTLSFEAGDYLTKTEASETYATTTELAGKADSIHVHNASDITDGTLVVARGGTGVSTAAAERERLGLGSTTGALPIANGGTGASNVTDARTGLDVYSKAEVDSSISDTAARYLPIGGGALTGNLFQSTTARGYYLKDVDGNNYPGVYENGANLWVGSTSTASTHHVGETYISAGYNKTTGKGNNTIKISVPNAANNGGTNYEVYHTGNKPTPADIGIVTGSSTVSNGAWGWVKLPGGIAIAHYYDTADRTVDITSTSGSICWASISSIAFPFTFAHQPSVSISASGTSNFFTWVSNVTTTATGLIYVGRGTQVSGVKTRLRITVTGVYS